MMVGREVASGNGGGGGGGDEWLPLEELGSGYRFSKEGASMLEAGFIRSLLKRHNSR